MRYEPNEFILSFDWLNEELSDDYAFDFDQAHQTAQKHLSQHSIKQVRDGLTAFPKLSQLAARRWHQEVERLLTNDPDQIIGVMNGRPQQFELLINDPDALKYSALKSFAWPEIFALLALSIIGEQIYHEQNFERLDKELGITDPAESTGTTNRRIEAALEALDASRIADRLTTADTTKNILKAAGAAGGKAKAARLVPLQTEIFHLADTKYANFSTPKAARRIYELLFHEVDDALTTEDPEERLVKWIRAYRKKTRTNAPT